MCRNGLFFFVCRLWAAERLLVRCHFDRRAVWNTDKHTDWEPPSSCEYGVVNTIRNKSPLEIPCV